MPPWRPVQITEEKVADASGGNITLMFALSHQVLPVWCENFALAGGGKKGVGEYALGPDPVAHNQWIEWTVPESAMEDAVRHVRQRVEAANTAMAQHVAESQRALNAAQAAEHAKQERIAEVQRRLDGL